MSFENFAGINNSEKSKSENYKKGENAINNLFNNPEEIKRRLDMANQQV